MASLPDGCDTIVGERGTHEELLAAGGRYAALVAGSGPGELVEIG